MYGEKMSKLNSVREDVKELRSCLGLLNRNRYPLAYKNILQLAYKVDSLSDFQYSIIVARIEKAVYCLSVSTLNSCLDYVDTLIKLTEEYMQIMAVNDFLSQEQIA